MNVIEKNAGQKISYSLDGNILTLRDEMMLNLSKYERDYDIELDICESRDNILVIGISDRYVAQLLIPARTYTEAAQTIPSDRTDDDGNPIQETVITKTPVPFSMDNVTLILWALNGGNENE